MSNVVAASLQFSFDGRVLTDSEELCQFDLVNTQASPVVVLIDDSIYDISYVSLMNSRASKQLQNTLSFQSYRQHCPTDQYFSDSYSLSNKFVRRWSASHDQSCCIGALIDCEGASYF
jgi:hypothetical protein